MDQDVLSKPVITSIWGGVIRIFGNQPILAVFDWQICGIVKQRGRTRQWDPSTIGRANLWTI
jgi:hypothetical protein